MEAVEKREKREYRRGRVARTPALTTIAPRACIARRSGSIDKDYRTPRPARASAFYDLDPRARTSATRTTFPV